MVAKYRSDFSHMSFAWPHLLWLLLVPATLLAWEWTHRRRAAAVARPKILRAEAGAHSLHLAALRTQPIARASRPRVWLALGLSFCVVALARPQWGRLEEPVFDQSREILLAMDLSRSMLAPDVRPSRLERAKLLIQSLLEKLAGERVGLVVFSGTAFLQSPLSADYEILREFLPALGPDFLPEGGTNYGAMLETSLQAFGTSSSADRFIIVLSDGEATDSDWRARVEELKKKGIRIIALGVGTAEGAMIPEGTGQFVKDERGAVVLSKLESSTLIELAQSTDGVYRDASVWIDLAALVNATIEAGRKGEFVEKNTVRKVERFQWPLALGLWCLLVSFCYEIPVRPKVRDLKLGPGTGAPPAKRPGSVPAKSVAASLGVTLLVLAAALPAPSRAAASLVPAAAPTTPSPPEELPLSKIVGRLASRDNRTARDWAELGRETVSWGSRLQSDKHPVPDGPVRDALAAVELGRKLDAGATDWVKLREELEALLSRNDDEKQQDQPSPDEKEQPQDQQKKDQKSDQKQQDESDPSQSSPSDKKGSGDSTDSPQNKESKPQEQKSPGDSAFGDMNQKEEPPPPPPEDTQNVGGAQENQDQPQEPTDPSLALPLQKLDQLRRQDSPAQLFQLMEGEKKATKKSGKNW